MHAAGPHAPARAALAARAAALAGQHPGADARVRCAAAHSLDTTIPLEFPPERVAMGALFAAVRLCNAQLPLPEGRSFAEHFNVEQALVTGGRRLGRGGAPGAASGPARLPAAGAASRARRAGGPARAAAADVAARGPGALPPARLPTEVADRMLEMYEYAAGGEGGAAQQPSAQQQAQGQGQQPQPGAPPPQQAQAGSQPAAPQPQAPPAHSAAVTQPQQPQAQRPEAAAPQPSSHAPAEPVVLRMHVQQEAEATYTITVQGAPPGQPQLATTALACQAWATVQATVQQHHKAPAAPGGATSSGTDPAASAATALPAPSCSGGGSAPPQQQQRAAQQPDVKAPISPEAPAEGHRASKKRRLEGGASVAGSPSTSTPPTPAELAGGAAVAAVEQQQQPAGASPARAAS
jgi:hypothetical protein